MNVDWSLFFSAVALAVVLESLPYILAPERMRKILGELSRSEPVVLRRYGLTTLCVGLFFLYIVRSVAA